MRLAHLHPLARNAPQALFKVHFGSLHAAHVARPRHREDQKIEGGLDNGPALVLVEPDEKSAKLLLVRDGGAVLYPYFQKRAAKGGRWDHSLHEGSRWRSERRLR